jgi:hypothetical protein
MTRVSQCPISLRSERPNALYHVTIYILRRIGVSVFLSHILATKLQQSHCHLKSHMKSSSHRLIPFLSLFCNCHFRRLDSIQFLCSQAHIPAGWRLETRLYSSRPLIYTAEHLYITTSHGPGREHSIYY